MKCRGILIALAMLIMASSAQANPIHNKHWHWRNPGVLTIRTPKKPRRHYQLAIVRPNPIVYMAHLAQQWWGMNACDGNYQILFADTYPGGDENTAVAFASWTTSNGINTETAPYAHYISCKITFVNKYYANANMMYANWPYFCGVFLHEFGHLLGWGHSGQIGNIMYPYIESKEIPQVCVTDPTGHNWATDGNNPWLATDAHAFHP